MPPWPSLDSSPTADTSPQRSRRPSMTLLGMSVESVVRIRAMTHEKAVWQEFIRLGAGLLNRTKKLQSVGVHRWRSAGATRARSKAIVELASSGLIIERRDQCASK